ncbi:MAG TPA: branched-chain amino acid ABC transporter permease/ATP-binding protein [Acidimicrobiales bacterium]|nr:branched-chain amino acid ABC transporter permease/ATP-binding protein [Acidimicrobiales bacterium]
MTTVGSSIVPFIVSGIVAGAIYGLAGSGLVLTYKTSGIFNFAHGAVAAAAAYLFYWLTNDVGLNWETAFVISVPILAIVLGILLELGTRSLVKRPIVLQIVGTVGILLIVEALTTIKFGPDEIKISQFLPGGTNTFRLFGVNIGWAQLTVVLFALVLTLALYACLRLTKVGLAMRAVVDNADLVGLHGTSPVQVRRLAWIVGAALAAVSGVLLAPFFGIQAIALTYLVIASIGAAAVGGFSSIPLTYAGGLVIGIVANVSQKYVLGVTSLAGLPQSVPFMVLLAALLVIPRRKLVTRSTPERSTATQRHAPAPISLVLGAIVLVVLVLVPTFGGTHMSYFLQAMSLGVMFLSIGLLVRTAGQVSLCQSIFGAIGAVAFSQFMLDLGLPWLVALLLGSLVLVPIAALIGLIAIRLSGLFLALATLAFAIIVQYFFFPLNFMFGSSGAGRLVPRPSFASSDDRYYYVLLLIFVIAALVVLAIDRGRLGRMLRGLSEAPTVLRTLGLSINTTKIIVFCISAFLAGMSGILYGGSVTYATYADANYQSFESFILLAIIATVPFGLPWYALFAIPVAIIPGYIGGENVTNWLTFIFGISAILIALQGGQPPMPKWVTALYDRFTSRRAPVVAEAALQPLVTTSPKLVRIGQPRPGLEVRDLKVRFGGLVAVDDLRFEAPIGRVTGLIGPNGAGKTTTFNACSGVVRPTEGQIFLHGRDVSQENAAIRARRGLGRTFQVTALCESLTVRQNVAMGREAGIAGKGATSQIVAGRGAKKVVGDAADGALELCGIARLADVQAGALSTGERRLVEVARCLAGDFDVLLLDEPTAGLDNGESQRLAQVLQTVMEQRQCGILLVEHDMAFVMGLCDYIYVLDFGRLLFEGPPDLVARSREVQAAYLGSEVVSTAPGAEPVPAELAERTPG